MRFARVLDLRKLPPLEAMEVRHQQHLHYSEFVPIFSTLLHGCRIGVQNFQVRWHRHSRPEAQFVLLDAEAMRQGMGTDFLRDSDRRTVARRLPSPRGAPCPKPGENRA